MQSFSANPWLKIWGTHRKLLKEFHLSFSWGFHSNVSAFIWKRPSVHQDSKGLGGRAWNLAVSLAWINTVITPLVAQMVKNPPAIQETWDWSLGQEIPWIREWLPTPVLPGEFHRQKRLAGYSPQSCKESDVTEWLTLSLPILVHTFSPIFPR